MRSPQSDAGADLPFPPLSKGLQESGCQFLLAGVTRALAVPTAGPARLIGQRQRLPSAAQEAVRLGGDAGQAGHRLRPRSHDVGAGLGEMVVPESDLIRARHPRLDTPQEGVPLQEHLVVLLQRFQVAGVDLRQRDVEVAAS